MGGGTGTGGKVDVERPAVRAVDHVFLRIEYRRYASEHPWVLTLVKGVSIRNNIDIARCDNADDLITYGQGVATAMGVQLRADS